MVNVVQRGRERTLNWTPSVRFGVSIYIHNFKFRNLKPYKCVLYLRVCISHEIVMRFI